MRPNIVITLPKKEKIRLQRLALRYGLSLPEFSCRILTELASEFQQESFDNYDNPAGLRASLARALADWQAGRVSPAS